MNIRPLFVGIFCCYIGSAFAISNIENERPDLPADGLSGIIKIGLDGKTGNQKEQNSEGAAKIIFRDTNEILLALIGREYGTKHEDKVKDNSFLHARWMHLLDEQWALESFAQWEKDEFDNLTSRTLAGGGGRYLAAQQKDVYSLAFGFGSFHEVEKQNLITYQETNRLWRVNSYYSFKYQLNEQLSVVNTTYFQPSTRDASDYRALFDLGLTIKMIDAVHLCLNYKLTYDSKPAKNLLAEPPIDNYKTNTQYKTTLEYRF